MGKMQSILEKIAAEIKFLVRNTKISFMGMYYTIPGEEYMSPQMRQRTYQFMDKAV